MKWNSSLLFQISAPPATTSASPTLQVKFVPPGAGRVEAPLPAGPITSRADAQIVPLTEALARLLPARSRILVMDTVNGLLTGAPETIRLTDEPSGRSVALFGAAPLTRYFAG